MHDVSVVEVMYILTSLHKDLIESFLRIELSLWPGFQMFLNKLLEILPGHLLSMDG